MIAPTGCNLLTWFQDLYKELEQIRILNMPDKRIDLEEELRKISPVLGEKFKKVYSLTTDCWKRGESKTEELYALLDALYLKLKGEI